MKSTKLIILLILMVFTISSSYAKIKNYKTETFKVYGNCEMCKKNIESAVKKKNIALGIWNSKSQTLIVTYDSTKTNANEILKRVANVGYDNEKYLTSNEVYNNLHACCQYERKVVSKPITTVPTVPSTIPKEIEEMPMDHDMKDTAKMVVTPVKPDETPIIEIKDTTKTVTTPTEKPDITKPEIVVTKPDFTALLTKYYALKNALIADNSTLASKSAGSLLAEIDAIKMESLSASEHTFWMKYYQKLKADATKISTSKDIEKQRVAFSSLSNNMWSTVKGLKIKNNGTIYVDYCPMKDAYWLSKESAIKNPYYGKSMLTCGSIKETIK